MKKYRVGYTAGVYDMFHIGHLNLLRRAKELCDCLIVGVNADELVKNYKNKTPVIGEQERLAIIQSIKYVDRAFITHTLDKEEVLKEISFDVVFVGDDWKGSHRWIETESRLQEKGVDVVFLPHTDGVSSTGIIEKIRMPGGGKTLRLGYTTGVFDMFHIGHLNLLKRARSLCDFLIVGVSTDSLVQNYKNKTPHVPFAERATIVDSVRFVDSVVPQSSMDKLEAWHNIGFNIMFHGDDWKGSELYENYEKEFAKVGAQIVYLPHTDGVSSSLLREKTEEEYKKEV